MGQAIANASNKAQGWREHGADPAIKPRQPEMTMGMGMGYDKKTPCFPTGNKFRGGHDDGTRKERKSAGGMNTKHKSPAAR